MRLREVKQLNSSYRASTYGVGFKPGPGPVYPLPTHVDRMRKRCFILLFKMALSSIILISRQTLIPPTTGSAKDKRVVLSYPHSQRAGDMEGTPEKSHSTPWLSELTYIVKKKGLLVSGWS